MQWSYRRGQNGNTGIHCNPEQAPPPACKILVTIRTFGPRTSCMKLQGKYHATPSAYWPKGNRAPLHSYPKAGIPAGLTTQFNSTSRLSAHHLHKSLAIHSIHFAVHKPKLIHEQLLSWSMSWSLDMNQGVPWTAPPLVNPEPSLSQQVVEDCWEHRHFCGMRKHDIPRYIHTWLELWPTAEYVLKIEQVPLNAPQTIPPVACDR